MDTLDEIIDELKVDAKLSADTYNALNFAKSNHPLGEGKTVHQRTYEVLCAIAGRDVNRVAYYKFENYFQKFKKKRIDRYDIIL